MIPFFKHLRVHPRLAAAVLAGLVVALLVPASQGWVTRALLGWNVTVWLYLLLIGWVMAHADHGHLRRIALAQAESAGTVLAIVIMASLVSLLGIVVELSAAKGQGAPHGWPHVLFALSTVVGSWLLLLSEFALTYASRFYRSPPGSGLQFPAADAGFKPDYGDFLYFSVTIAVASQTADVNVVTAPMRRLVMLQSLVSFGFNTAILAFTVNLAASMF